VHGIITVFGLLLRDLLDHPGELFVLQRRSGRSCRRALSAHSRCCRGVIKKRSGGSSIIGIYPSLTVSSPCCTHRALHRRCNVGAFRTPVTLANARRCRPTQLSSCKKRILVIAITSRAQWPS
jgi:hypothetical protein